MTDTLENRLRDDARDCARSGIYDTEALELEAAAELERLRAENVQLANDLASSQVAYAELHAENERLTRDAEYQRLRAETEEKNARRAGATIAEMDPDAAHAKLSTALHQMATLRTENERLANEHHEAVGWQKAKAEWIDVATRTLASQVERIRYLEREIDARHDPLRKHEPHCWACAALSKPGG